MLYKLAHRKYKLVSHKSSSHLCKQGSIGPWSDLSRKIILWITWCGYVSWYIHWQVWKEASPPPPRFTSCSEMTKTTGNSHLWPILLERHITPSVTRPYQRCLHVYTLFLLCKIRKNKNIFHPQVYIGTQNVRGVPADVWTTCMTWPNTTGTINATFYFSRKCDISSLFSSSSICVKL